MRSAKAAALVLSIALSACGPEQSAAPAFAHLGLADVGYAPTAAELAALAAAEAAILGGPADGKLAWAGPGGAEVRLTVLREGRTASGRPCREVGVRAAFGPRSRQASHTACRGPDGAWSAPP